MAAVWSIIIFAIGIIICTASAQSLLPTAPWCLPAGVIKPIDIRVPRCRQNEVYSCCGPCVQKTCSTLKRNVNCLLCAQGCFCRAGYVRKVAGGICVPLSSCLTK